MKKLAVHALTFALLCSSLWPAAAQDKNQITVATNEVLLDVIVRDQKNRMIKDLTAADFSVTEDGVPQKIESFRLVTRTIEPANKSAGVKPLPIPTNNAPATQPLRVGAAEIGVSTVALVFDRLNIESRSFAVEAAKNYAKENLNEKDFVGVYAIDQRLNAIQNFTRDMQQVQDGIARVSTMAGTRYTLYTQQRQGSMAGALNYTSSGLERDLNVLALWQQQISVANADPAIATLTAVEEQINQLTRRSLEAFDRLARERQGWATIDGLLSIIAAQKQLPGRKAIVLFSEGLAVPPHIQPQFRDVVSVANQANITIYAVDALGLRIDSLASESRRQQNELAAAAAARVGTGSENLRGVQTKDLERNEEMVTANEQTFLKLLSDGTGGFLIKDTNDLTKRLARVDEEMRSYYLLSYATTNQNYDGKFRRIGVTTKRRELTVQARQGYYAFNPAALSTVVSFETAALNLLNQPASQAATLPLQSAALSFPQATALSRVPIMAQLSAAELGYQEDKAANRYNTDFRVVALIKDQSKQVVSKLSQHFQLAGALDKLAEAKRGQLTFYREAELPAGRYDIELAALDAITNKSSVRRFSLEVVAEGEGKLNVSSLMLVQSIAQASASQAADNLFRANDVMLFPNLGAPIRKSVEKQITFFFSVRPAKDAAGLSAQLEVAQNGKSLAQLPLPLPAPDASGRIQCVSGLPSEALPVGTYELRVIVKDGQQSVARAVTLIVEP